MDTGIVFQQMLILVLVMAVGFAVRRLGLLDAAGNVYLTNILLKVTLPATMLTAIGGSTIHVPLYQLFILFGATALSFGVMMIAAFLSPLAMAAKRDERSVYTALGLFGNVNFMGIPLAFSLFGPDGMFYAVLYNIVFNLLIYSLGMKLIGGKRAKISVKFFLTPVMIASVLSLLFFLADVRLPYVIDSSLGLLGRVTSPLAMLLLGSILGGMHVKEMFRGWRVYGITMVRLFIAPIAVYFALSPLPLRPLFLSVLIVMSASPMAISTATFAIHYGRHEEIAGKGVFLSTLFSVVSMPIVLAWLL